LEALKQESEMPLEDLLKSLPAEMFDSAAGSEDDHSTDQKVQHLWFLSHRLLSLLDSKYFVH